MHCIKLFIFILKEFIPMFFLLWAANCSLLHLALGLLYIQYQDAEVDALSPRDQLDELSSDLARLKARFYQDAFWIPTQEGTSIQTFETFSEGGLSNGEEVLSDAN